VYNTNMFQFELVVTEACNMSCKYCYMKNQKNSMSKDVFDAHFGYLPSLLKLYNEKSYAAVFFGGEPLLNWDLIEYILPIISKDPKCEQITMPTNGLLLTRERYKILKDFGVHVSISYDGLWQKEKPGSICWVGEKSFKVMVSPERSTTLVDNYHHFLRMGIPSPDFTLVRDDIWTIEDVAKIDKELIELADEVIRINRNVGPSFPGIFSLYMMDSVSGKRFGKRPYGCFAGCHGAGFMPDGKVYPCARFGSDKTYSMFDSKKRKMMEDGLHFSLFRDPAIAGLRDNPKCKKCNLYTFCNGGCTYSQLTNAPGYEFAIPYSPKGSDQKYELMADPVENLCRILKRCYSESFRIMNELKGTPEFQKLIQNMLEVFNG